MSRQVKTKKTGNPLHNQKGQGLVEYLIIVAIMAVGAMGVIRVLGHTTKARFAQVTSALSGDAGSSVTVEKVQKQHYRKSDMSDFFKGSRGNKR